MKIAGAGVCPLVRVGDIVKGRTVVDIVCDRHVGTACSAYKTLAMLRLYDVGEPRRRLAPPRVVNCNECPVLAKDPNHRSKTKWRWELIDEAMERGDLFIYPVDPSIGRMSPSEREPLTSKPKESKPVTLDRFELIDISEEEQDEESGSDTGKQ